ncbi:1-phosphatidylinositol-3-phosphate 5-kinase [Pseudogymnoascus destructans]|uniref:1-phosphatidylinositol-3-phosphate 5-kinase n=2 Tax=Pseudogymnoascus destructans TaxID=655981 RepID=L8FRD7_PSED2|nr:1-phosphatidylinositol-3-phosphate 5-kinase [Pseudogymnoascus destructans]ELR03550.1 hypothetical protein GMDG_01301 [Pseudogymnoascus destructans 20631-21]OAF60626.1 1-phosphatidylinositol-3-phosphate 5-kinase [Pseudogymnoascus destructans]
MSSQDSPQNSSSSRMMASLPSGLRSRRGSLASLGGSSQADKEQLTQALDAIHNTASHSETLTTFNEFASPPSSSLGVESKGIAGELMQNGLSGLYSRFRGVVGGAKDKGHQPVAKNNVDSREKPSTQGQNFGTSTANSSVPAISREESNLNGSTGEVVSDPPPGQLPIISASTTPSGSSSQLYQSSKASTHFTPTTAKALLSSRPGMTSRSESTAAAAAPTSTPVNVVASEDREIGADSSKEPGESGSVNHFMARRTNHVPLRAHPIEDWDAFDIKHSDAPSSEQGHGRGGLPFMPSLITSLGTGHEMPIIEGQEESSATSSRRSAKSSQRPLDAHAALSANHTSQKLNRPTAIDRFSQSHLPGYQSSRASSTERSATETSPVNTSTRNSVNQELFYADESHHGRPAGANRTPGSTLNEGGPDVVNARLEQMRKQVLSKEFWMADEICKECFLCGDPFTAFRRKHHCRTCGCIFDSKCTSIISGERFGVQGTLRVCRTCLDIINRRHDYSGSDDESGDDTFLPSSFFQSHQTRLNSMKDARAIEEGPDGSFTGRSLNGDSVSSITTPMMAIPATRRIGDSENRRSAVLEIDAPQLGRPSSSRSLKALSLSRPLSSGQKANQPKHNFLGRFRSTAAERPPFHSNSAADEIKKRSRLPALHDDNIIDPDLAPYMSDDESSGDEQMSIFTALNGNSGISTSYENEKSAFGSLPNATKKHRSRAGEKSISGLSFSGRPIEDNSWAGSVSHGRSNRRRNLSTSSNVHIARGSPRQNKPGALTYNYGELSEETIIPRDDPLEPSSYGASKMTRSASMRNAKAPAVELNNASLHHVRRLLRQLLQDACVENVASWEKALIPILLQCTDDVNPDVRRGDDIDIRHYVKLKKIPGGKPGDTSYVSGVVFTKNLALKSMARSISQPRIVIISFPIEYQRHQQHFMSLEPVIAQEKDFLKNMVNRIASLRPHVVLIQSHISGLALQYLAEANIAVAYNVKQSVIEAVSRFAHTEIISSIDMVALKPVHVGKSAGFDVKTYVHNDIPGTRKTCIYISGCPKDLGCTIVLRGASMAVLSTMKRITEFMVYVVYNLKLETCLMRDEFVLIPAITEDYGTLALGSKSVPEKTDSGNSSVEPVQKSVQDTGKESDSTKSLDGAATGHNESQGSPGELGDNDPQLSFPQATINTTAETPTQGSRPDVQPKPISTHESHVHEIQVLPEDIPMPTFYSDMVAKHQTKILSASPFVKFTQPYLLMNAREQERRLVYLKRLRDQDTFEDQTDVEKANPQRFQLIHPEMVHETVRGAPRQIMEVLHAVHDAEYDKALHNYQTQKRQWENYIQGNLNLFDPYSHQNIVVLYTVVCTATTVPCAGPDLTAMAFYNEHETSHDFFPDCTLGQYVEDLCLTVDAVCASNGCERKMSEHHRTYVHGEARITVFVEASPCKLNGLQDSILMWSYCKICKKETQVMPMSESTWKYSFGKYLELSFWSTELRLRAGFCPHDLHRNHLRYFGFRNATMRIHYDPIDLLEIVVPRTRITWKVDNDLRLKNDLFTKTEDRWNRFMASVKSRIKGINIDSVVSDKVEACMAEVETLSKRAQDEHASLLNKLQEKYMESKYYEIIPMNRAIRAMQERVAEWDTAFTDFDRNFFPSEKDIRRLAALQLKNLFLDRDASATPNETPDQSQDIYERQSDEGQSGKVANSVHDNNDMPPTELQGTLAPLVEEEASIDDAALKVPGSQGTEVLNATKSQDTVHHLDLAIPWVATSDDAPAVNSSADQAGSPLPSSESKPVTISDNTLASRLELHISEADLPKTPQQVRKESQADLREGATTNPEPSGIPRPSDRNAGRRSGLAVSPPILRTQSQPAVTLRRTQPATLRAFNIAAKEKANAVGIPPDSTIPLGAFSGEQPKDKRLSDRLGLGSLKSSRKPGHSLIPRSIHSKGRETKVSTLAKHFEQLSREFEKERLRDKKQRAAKVTQSRAFPKASSKPIVEVYKDVNEAVEERGPSEEGLRPRNQSSSNIELTGPTDGISNANTKSKLDAHNIPAQIDTSVAGEDTVTEVETDDNQQTLSQTASDDEAAASDTEHSFLEDMPSIKDITESLEVSETISDVDLPKHEKTSLMKMLTNFWAERSASGWTQLEYPLHATDHVFVDSDVIVREDEPSSLIAFSLSSQDYIEKLHAIRQQGQTNMPERTSGQERYNSAEADVETSLLRATGTHLKYQFAEGSAKMLCKIFYAEQFDAVRRKCGASDRIVESLSRCLKWDSKGGKTKSVFLKTLDERLVLKSLSPVETQAFLRFAPAYFNIMAEALFHELPSVIAKMLGFYQIIIKNPVTGTEIKWDVLVMENLFYDRAPTRIFDLKGSMRNRKIQSTGEQNEVLLDENMVEFIYESPLFAREHSKKLLKASVWNDTLFLARQDVMDYSLMVAVDEARKELVVGIIDCIRTYTWDKKLESWIKDRGFAGGGRNRPTVTSPKEYKSRFREAMDRYVLQAPNCWHHFGGYDGRASK